MLTNYTSTYSSTSVWSDASFSPLKKSITKYRAVDFFNQLTWQLIFQEYLQTYWHFTGYLTSYNGVPVHAMNCIKHFQEQFIYVSTINMMVSLFLIKRPHTFTSCIWHTTTFTVGSFLTPKTFIIRAASLSVIRSKGILTITAVFIQSLVMIFHTLFIVFLLILQTQKGYHLWTWALGRVQPQHRGFRIHFWGVHQAIYA